MYVKGRRRQDLRFQLLALYLLFVVPIFGVGIFFYYNASIRLRADVAAADLSLARAIALETDDVLLKAREAVATFAQTPTVVRANPAEMSGAFAAGALARQDINLFYRLSESGIMLYHYPPGPGSTVGDDFSFRDYFRQAQQTGGHVFSKGRISPTTGRPVISSVMAVFKEGRFDGVVAMNLELQRLTETLQRISADRSQNAAEQVIIVDAAGQIIAHSHSSELLANVRSTMPGVDAVLTRQEGSLTVQDDGDEAWLYSYTPIPSAGWGVIVRRPAKTAFASLDNLQRGLILALVLFGLGAILFWIVLSRQVINPLEALTRYGKLVSEEQEEPEQDREKLLPISERSDQIGNLTRSLLQAERDLRRRYLELATLNKTSTAVVSPLDTERVIDRILDEIQTLLSVRQCALLVVNTDRGQLEVQASRGLSQEYPMTVDIGGAAEELPAMQAISSNQPVQVPNLDSNGNILAHLSMSDTGGYRSGLIIPLKAPHIPPAALAIYREDVHRFSKQEIDLATSFANHAAIAFEHATLFSLTDAELQKQVRSLSALNRVGRTVSQSLVLDEVLDNAMDAAFEIMPADACWIYLQRENETFLRLRAQRGIPAEIMEHVRDERIEYEQGAIGWVAARGRSVLLNTLHLEANDWSDDPILASGYWQSFAASPLLAKESVIGVLGMATHSNRVFAEHDLELLQAIGDQIAIAVVNARLYRRSREVATLEERTRVAREIHDTLAQGFTGILVQLQAAERLSLKRPEQALQSLQEARDLARESLQEARQSVFNLRPTVLENQTLDQAIARQANRFEGESGIETNFILEGYPSPLNPDVEKNLYRITQEALTNIRRHAQASSVKITLMFEQNNVTLSIADDGKGLNGHLRDQRDIQRYATVTNGHFGLLGIQERVNLMEGAVFFNTPPTGGTEIKVVIPGQ